MKVEEYGARTTDINAHKFTILNSKKHFCEQKKSVIEVNRPAIKVNLIEVIKPKILPFLIPLELELY